MVVAITGGFGFIGSYLQKRVGAIPIPRQMEVGEIRELLKGEGVELVVNLAGATIFRPWTSQYKREILESRVKTTSKIVEAIEGVEGVKMFISVSGTAIYPQNRECGEECPEIGKGFLAKVALEWERAALQSSKPTALLRLGVVFGNGGGMWEKLKPAAKLGFLPVIGDGSYYLSYIHIEELVSIIQFLFWEGISGTFNATTPNPVPYLQLVEELKKRRGKPVRPIFIPPFLLKPIFRGLVEEVLTASYRVYPRNLERIGYKFRYPTLSKVISSLYF